jgi:hypothetical protein
MNASASASPAARPPTQRDLRSPYFLLRTPDGLGSYFTEENRPIVRSPKEPLARFLAPARIVETGNVRSIRFELTEEMLATASPMEFLPQSEIDAFAAAVRAFYEKAHAAAPRVVPHEKRLRAHFRLPDPEQEPDAYWVYGPVQDRRLLILWGCEAKAGTSLPLAPDVELKIPSGRTVLDQLQARVMNWEVRQREAVRFAFDSNEPISRFLARPAVNAAGQSVGVSCQGRTLASRALKPLRRVYAGECAAFERAAKTFYDRAGAPGRTAYEKEIRQAFRLPDPDRAGGGYWLAGKKLVIVVAGKEDREQTLPLIDHPLVPPVPVAAPAATETGEGPVVVGGGAELKAGTVAGKLRSRSISSAVVRGLALAAALAVAALGWGGWKLAHDRTAPRVVESGDYPAALNNHQVVIKFSKPIDAASLQLAAAGHPSFDFGDDAARVESAQLDPQDPSRVLLATTPLSDGRSYRITVDAVADRKGNRLAEATSVGFKYLDSVAPELKTVSAGQNSNQLLLVFSKPVAESSVARGGNYSLFALEAGGEGAAQRISSGRLDPEDKSGRTVILESVRDFVGNQPYRLEALSGVTDTAVSRNPVALPAKGLDFAYRDVLPPRLRGISASASKLELTITFSKPLEPASARDLRNYSAAGPDKNGLNFLNGAATLDATGRNVTLRLVPGPLSLGIYRLTVAGLSDRMGNRLPAPLSSPFEFADADRTALKILSHSIVTADNQVDNKVTLTFNRALDPADAVKPSNYTLAAGDGSSLDWAVSEARRVPDDPAQVILILSQAPVPGVKLQVRIAALADIFGQKLAAPIEYAFTPPGIPQPAEQVLDWIDRPVLRGNELTLTIKEEVDRKSALAAKNFVFNAPAARVLGISRYEVKTDAKTGSRRTLLAMQVEVPAAARRGLNLRARDLRAQGLEFLGDQRLRPVDVAQP